MRDWRIAEYAVIVLIFAIIAFVGFAWGILVGLLAAAVLFAVEYGRIDIVRYTLTGRDYQTRADSSDERLDMLRDNGDAILLLRLQGFLFFGTADRLRKRIQQRIAEHTGVAVRFLVIDFDRVNGLDSSAVVSFIRLAQMAARDGFVLVLTGLSEAVRDAMLRGGLEHGDGSAVRIEPSFDHGVEWCEDTLLADVAPRLATTRNRPARDMLIDIVSDPAFAEALMPYFERIEIAGRHRADHPGQPLRRHLLHRGGPRRGGTRQRRPDRAPCHPHPRRHRRRGRLLPRGAALRLGRRRERRGRLALQPHQPRPTEQARARDRRPLPPASPPCSPNASPAPTG